MTMTYTPKSRRGKAQEHKYSGKFPIEEMHGAINLECEACKKNIKKLNQFIDQGKNAAFVTFTKDGAFYHIIEVERSLRAPKKK